MDVKGFPCVSVHLQIFFRAQSFIIIQSFDISIVTEVQTPNSICILASLRHTDMTLTELTRVWWSCDTLHFTWHHTQTHATHTHLTTHTHTHTHTHTQHTLHTHVGFYGLRGLSICVMVFILYKLYVLLPFTYPTPKLSPHRRRCISIFPQKTYSVWFISVLNYGDTENVLINHILLVIPMSYLCHYTNLCPHKPHKHAHPHTHTHTNKCKYTHKHRDTERHTHTRTNTQPDRQIPWIHTHTQYICIADVYKIIF